ncbi:MAG: glutamine-hydrolyzing carbamoyl-phosphate synthase small subunit [Streptosporangiaceae bacterium]
MTQNDTRPALLVLEDGTALHGSAFGAEGETFGEMVFNTGMTGYQETLTDPSYCRQIVAMTAPHIGNTGVNDEDPESRQVWVSGYVVREPSRLASSWRATRDLDAYLRAEGVTGIAIRGTRLLTRRVREQGAMRAAISTVETDPGRLLERVLASPQMTGADLARLVSTPEPYTVHPQGPARYRVVAVDLGIKASTPRNLAARGCEVVVVPAAATAQDILAASPDGVFFSNGPGDPAAATYAVAAMRGVIDAGLPVFGICLGSQILARALGLSTYKLRYGHRGINQPVMDLTNGRVYITSHNHGFAAALPGQEEPGQEEPGQEQAGQEEPGRTDPGVSAETPGGPAVWSHVPPQAREPFGTPYGPAAVSYVNLNDGVVEGLRLIERPVFSVQYHPEAAPGPHDAADHFDQFCAMLGRAQ